MHRKQYAAIFDSTFISLRLVFRNTHPHQSADEAAHCATHTQSRQRAHNRTSSNERSHARDGERTDSSKKTEGPTHNAACSHPRGRALGSLRVLLMSELLRALSVGKQHRYVIVRKAGLENTVNGLFRLNGTLIDAENGCVFSCHTNSPLDSETRLMLHSYLVGYLVSATGNRYSFRHDGGLFVLR